jgi:hypothetical protein
MDEIITLITENGKGKTLCDCGLLHCCCYVKTSSLQYYEREAKDREDLVVFVHVLQWFQSYKN